MNLLRTIGLTVAAFALLAPLSAHADVPAGWYLGANTDLVFQDDTDATLSSTTYDLEYKTGWGLAGYGGYAWGNGFRTEGELVYRHSALDAVDGSGSGANGGGIHNWALMGNVLYDFDTNSRITPYIGAGIGAALVDADELRSFGGVNLDDDRVAFAYQGIVGTSIDLEGGWDFTADYRYFRTTDVKFKSSTAARGEVENASHNLMLGVRYTFEEPMEKAPARMAELTPVAPVRAPVAPAVQAPAVAPVPQSYMVFFNFDRSTLTQEAKRIIATAAADYNKGGYVRLIVTGHTDTMGTSRYNQMLSERRAEVVLEEFIRLGVPAPEIMSTGAGENGLMVPTADQIREAQNRRAEIVLQK